MTIISPAKMRVEGVFQEGHQISCSSERCGHASAFFPDRKHLPAQVVANKFRERGWEVNANGQDLCPSCRIVHREKKAAKTGHAAIAQKAIIREVQLASAVNARKLISGVGLLPTEVIQLEHKDTKFKVTFRNMLQVPLGQLTAAEGELVEGFRAALISSNLKFEIENRLEKAQYIFEPVLHWYVTLAVQNAKVVNMRAAGIAAE
jgi:hypothetical protein